MELTTDFPSMGVMNKLVQGLKTDIAKEVKDIPFSHVLTMDKVGPLGTRLPAKRVRLGTSINGIAVAAYNSWVFCYQGFIIADENDLEPDKNKEYMCVIPEYLLSGTNERRIMPPEGLVLVHKYVKEAMLNYKRIITNYMAQVEFDKELLEEPSQKKDRGIIFEMKCLCGGVGCNSCEPQGRG